MSFASFSSCVSVGLDWWGCLLDSIGLAGASVVTIAAVFRVIRWIFGMYTGGQGKRIQGGGLRGKTDGLSGLVHGIEDVESGRGLYGMCC